jgi:DNA-binding HxlR family transcriptional regulator
VTRSAPHVALARTASGRHSPAPAEAAEAPPPGGESFCPVAEAAALLGDTWTLLLLRELAGGPRRFKELEASTGISPRVLTDRLRALCERGMMTRRMYPEIPPRVEYELTEKGRDALPVLDALRAFGERWLRPAGAQRAAVGRPAAEVAACHLPNEAVGTAAQSAPTSGPRRRGARGALRGG